MNALKKFVGVFGRLWGNAAAAAGAWSTRRIRVVSGSVALLVVVVAAACGYLLFQTRQDHNDTAMRAQALAAGVRDVPALLSYQAKNVDQDFESKYSLVTGQFRTQFEQLSKQTIIPAAKDRDLSTKAEVANAGVTSAQDDSVTLLLFINQSTTSKDQPGTRLDGSRVQVVMSKVGDDWKVAGLTPV